MAPLPVSDTVMLQKVDLVCGERPALHTRNSVFLYMANSLFLPSPDIINQSPYIEIGFHMTPVHLGKGVRLASFLDGERGPDAPLVRDPKGKRPFYKESFPR